MDIIPVAIPLGNDFAALVDEADAPLVRPLRWHVVESPNGKVHYAATYLTIPDTTESVPMFMHRLLMEAEPDQVVDHRNGDGLDNRRQNLRFATFQQNAVNARTREDSPLGLKGVRETSTGRYSAAIVRFGKRQGLGTFDTPEEAARAYNLAALESDGEFARPNILPPNGEFAGAYLQIKSLGPRRREILRLFIEEGLAFHEVAERVGLKPRWFERELAKIRKSIECYQFQQARRGKTEWRSRPWLERFLERMKNDRSTWPRG